jgi:hypothetical protein
MGPFSFAFGLTDGSGLGDLNNTVILSDFLLGGGTLTGTPQTEGGVTGDLGSSITMTDNSFLNFLIQGFEPGSMLSLIVHLTTNVDPGGTPDAFFFSILDIPTLDPTGANTLLAVNIDSANPTIFTYAGDPLDAPVLSALGPTQVPEPSSSLLLLTGLVGILIAALRRKKQLPTNTNELAGNAVAPR